MGAETIPTVRHTITLVQEAEMRLKTYEGLNSDDPSMMHISMAPQNGQIIMSIQSQSRQANIQIAGAMLLGWTGKLMSHVTSVEV